MLLSCFSRCRLFFKPGFSDIFVSILKCLTTFLSSLFFSVYYSGVSGPLKNPCFKNDSDRAKSCQILSPLLAFFLSFPPRIEK